MFIIFNMLPKMESKSFGSWIPRHQIKTHSNNGKFVLITDKEGWSSILQWVSNKHSGHPVFTRSRCSFKGLKGLPHSLKAPAIEGESPQVSHLWFNSLRAYPSIKSRKIQDNEKQSYSNHGRWRRKPLLASEYP